MAYSSLEACLNDLEKNNQLVRIKEEGALSQLIEFAALSAIAALVAFGAGVLAAKLVVTYVFEFPFSPDWAKLALIPLFAIFLAVFAAFLAALPALNARPAEGLRAL